MIETLDLDLKNKVAIVAGGGSAGDGIGNGRAASILLAEAGAKVLVVDKDKELADYTVQMIEKRGGESLSISADLTKPNPAPRSRSTPSDSTHLSQHWLWHAFGSAHATQTLHPRVVRHASQHSAGASDSPFGPIPSRTTAPSSSTCGLGSHLGAVVV